MLPIRELSLNLLQWQMNTASMRNMPVVEFSYNIADLSFMRIKETFSY